MGSVTVLFSHKNQGTSYGLGVIGDAVSEASFSDIGHTVLDVAGMVPVIGEAADLANAGWYLAEGDKTNAALSAAGAIPFAGNAATWRGGERGAKHAIISLKSGERQIVRGGADGNDFAPYGNYLEKGDVTYTSSNDWPVSS